jgi:glycosyltransferase involved in cell wall biosynthesis
LIGFAIGIYTLIEKPSTPHISIITPCLNRVDFVSDAIESVLHQDYPNFEHIIIDGGSTDGTLKELSKYSHLRVISESDGGIYDAINKGILLVKGDIIGLLNTDDQYEKDVFHTVSEKFLLNPETDACLGGVVIFKDALSGDRIILNKFMPFPEKDFLYNATLGVPLFNGWLFRKKVFEQYGFFDKYYKYSSDRDFLIRLALGRMKYLPVYQNFYLYRSHPGSITFRDSNNVESEFVYEFRSIAVKYLNTKGITDAEKRIFLSWYSQITVEQSLYSLKKIHPARAIHHAYNGIRYNPLWPYLFIRSAILVLRNRILGNRQILENNCPK